MRVHYANGWVGRQGLGRRRGRWGQTTHRAAPDRRGSDAGDTTGHQLIHRRDLETEEPQDTQEHPKKPVHTDSNPVKPGKTR